MTDTTFVEGQIIEGRVTGNLHRNLLMDAYFTFADFLVTRIATLSRETEIAIQIAFLDSQSDIINPPRNSVVRATVNTSPFAKAPFSATTDTLMLTNIEFVERGTGRVISRIPSALKFKD
ncbi:MAG: hypothetical protein WDM86_09125 [Rhizomicrobium sp.]